MELNSAPLRRFEVAAWILGSALRRCAPCSARGWRSGGVLCQLSAL